MNIEPVLSAKEWKVQRFLRGPNAIVRLHNEHAIGIANLDEKGGELHSAFAELAALPAVIAVANDRLDDDDPRKITRTMIDALRTIVNEWDGCGRNPAALEAWVDCEGPEPPMEYFGDRIDGSAILDALASYLQPKETT